MQKIPGFDFTDEQIENFKKTNEDDGEEHRSVKVFKTISTTKKMRLLSEAALDEVLPWHLKKGVAYFYKEYYDGINDFDGGYKKWKAWTLQS